MNSVEFVKNARQLGSTVIAEQRVQQPDGGRASKCIGGTVQFVDSWATFDPSLPSAESDAHVQRRAPIPATVDHMQLHQLVREYWKRRGTLSENYDQ